TDFRSCRVERPLRPIHVRVLQPDFRICRRRYAEYAAGRSRQNSFLELPLELRHLVFCKKSPLAGPQLLIFKKSNTDAPKFLDWMSNRLKHAPDLLVAALMQRHLKPRIIAALQLLDFTGGQAFIVDIRAAAQSIQITLLRKTGNLDVVHLRDGAG